MTITTVQVTIYVYTPYFEYVKPKKCCNWLALVIERDICFASKFLGNRASLIMNGEGESVVLCCVCAFATTKPCFINYDWRGGECCFMLCLCFCNYYSEMFDTETMAPKVLIQHFCRSNKIKDGKVIIG